MLDTHTTTGQRTHNTLGKLATDFRSIIHQARAPRNVGNVALFRNSFYFVTNRPGHRKGKQNREGERERVAGALKLVITRSVVLVLVMAEK
jgi:hypothetical protein